MTPELQNKISVLFVDDEQLNLDAFKMNFRRDLSVFTAISSEHAESILNQEHIDVVVSDQRMPEKTGVEFLTEIRTTHPDVMRILVTGYTDIEAVVSAINDAQVFNYVTKPFRPEELLAQIQRAHEVNDTRQQRDIFLKRSQHLYSVSQNAVILFNGSGRIMDVNPAMERLLGYELMELKYLGMNDIMIDAEGLFSRTVDDVLDPRPAPLFLKTADGKLLDCKIAPMHISNDPQGHANYQAIILDHSIAVQSKTA